MRHLDMYTAILRILFQDIFKFWITFGRTGK